MPEMQLTIKSMVVAPDTLEATINEVSSRKTFHKWLNLDESIDIMSKTWTNPQCDDLTGKLFYIEKTEE
jgi:hypothetical protein